MKTVHKYYHHVKKSLGFPGHLYLAITLIAILFITANLLATFSEFESKKNAVLQNPQNIRDHLALANYFVVENDLENLKKEVAVINNLPADDQLIYKQEIAKLKNLAASEQVVKENLNSYQKLSTLFPTFRDLLLKRAILNYRLKKDTEAKVLLEAAKKLDPNASKVKDVEIFFERSNNP